MLFVVLAKKCQEGARPHERPPDEGLEGTIFTFFGTEFQTGRGSSEKPLIFEVGGPQTAPRVSKCSQKSLHLGSCIHSFSLFFDFVGILCGVNAKK